MFYTGFPFLLYYHSSQQNVNTSTKLMSLLLVYCLFLLFNHYYALESEIMSLDQTDKLDTYEKKEECTF